MPTCLGVLPADCQPGAYLVSVAQVETTPVGLQLDLGDAVLVGRTMVEGLNGVVRAKGAQKLDILTAIKDFKRGIYQLEWEHKKCEMQVRWLPPCPGVCPGVQCG